jgi:hypothetical protein
MQLTVMPKVDACAAASVLLYSRLWWELESIYLALTQWPNTHELHCAEDRIMVFRLEVLFVLEACDSPRWRSMLRPGECSALQTTLDTVLKTLDVPSCHMDGALIGSAQNLLFDAVLGHIPGRDPFAVDRRVHPSDDGSTPQVPATFLSRRSRTPNDSCNSRMGSPMSS